MSGRRAEAGSWAAIWSDQSEANARIVAGSLESDGIRVRLEWTPGLSARPGFGMSEGTWVIAVRRADAVRARQLLQESDEGRNLLEGDAGEGLTSSQRATLRFALTALLLTGALALAIAIMAQS